MLSSILSNNRDVVSLVPVQQMTSSYLCDLTKQVIIILFILLQNHTHIRNMVYNIDIQ